jgi:hypothetical protein
VLAVGVVGCFHLFFGDNEGKMRVLASELVDVVPILFALCQQGCEDSVGWRRWEISP